MNFIRQAFSHFYSPAPADHSVRQPESPSDPSERFFDAEGVPMRSKSKSSEPQTHRRNPQGRTRRKEDHYEYLKFTSWFTPEQLAALKKENEQSSKPSKPSSSRRPLTKEEEQHFEYLKSTSWFSRKQLAALKKDRRLQPLPGTSSEPANHSVNQPESISDPSERFFDAEGVPMRSKLSTSGLGTLRRSARQTALLAQMHSRPKSDKECLAVWEAWARDPERPRGEPRKEREQRLDAFIRLKEWFRDGDPTKQLKLNGLGLRSLPPLPDSVQNLDLSNNRRLADWLTHSPDNLLPPALRRLDLSGNWLTHLPDNLLPPALQEIDLSNNLLTHLPDKLPPSLQGLFVNDNLLTYLPDNLPPSLKKVNLSSNNLTRLPKYLTSNGVEFYSRRPQNCRIVLMDNPLDKKALKEIYKAMEYCFPSDLKDQPEFVLRCCFDSDELENFSRNEMWLDEDQKEHLKIQARAQPMTKEERDGFRISMQEQPMTEDERECFRIRAQARPK